MIGGDGDRHPGVDAAIPEQQPLILGAGDLRVEDAPIESLGHAGIGTLAHRRGAHVVFVGAVLPVQQLRADHDRRVAVEQLDLHGHHGQMARGHADHPRRADLDAQPGARAPDQFTAQHAVGKRQGAPIGLEVGDVEQQRLVFDVDLDHLGIRHVDQGLTDAGQPEGLFSVVDLPGLVEPVDEGAMRVGVAALLGVAPHTEVAVGHRKKGLGRAEILHPVFVLHQRPLIDREPRSVQRVDGGRGDVGGGVLVCHQINSAKSETTTSAPLRFSASAPAPRSTPITKPKSPAAPAWTPEMASSKTTQRCVGTPSCAAA